MFEARSTWRWTPWFSLLTLAACTRVGFDASASSGCDGVDCSGHGTCIIESEISLCECEPGYKRVDLRACLPEPIDAGRDSGDLDAVLDAGMDVATNVDAARGDVAGGDAARRDVVVFDAAEEDAAGGDAEVDAGAADAGCDPSRDCDDGDPCTQDLCAAGGCEHLTQDLACDDDDPFTVADVCIGGRCNGVSILHRSVGPGNSATLATGAGNPMTLYGRLATFAAPLDPRVGVGDALQYDSDDDGDVGALAFVRERRSDHSLVIVDASGAAPTPLATPDEDWALLRAYTSLATAEQGQGFENPGIATVLRPFERWSGGKDLVADAEQLRIACYGDGVDRDALILDGWVTGPLSYIKIFTPVDTAEVGRSQRHAGAWTAQAYALEPVQVERAIDIRVHHVWIDGLQIASKSDGIYLSDPEINLETPNKFRFCNNIVRYVGSGGGAGIYDYSCGSLGLNVWNNVVYDFPDICIGGHAASPAFYSNNTVVNCAAGIWRDHAEIVARGNIAMSCGDGFVGEFGPASDFNISDIDDDAPNNSFAGGLGAVLFVSTSAQNFHLDPADSAAIDQGLDMRVDLDLRFDRDVDGEPRPCGRGAATPGCRLGSGRRRGLALSASEH